MRENIFKKQVKSKNILHKKVQIKAIKDLGIQQQDTSIQAQEINYQIKNISKKIKKISIENYWGELIDSLAHHALIPLLQEQDIFLNGVWTHCQDRSINKHWQIDILAHSDTEIVAVNFYPFLEIKDVDNFIENIKRFKKCSLLSSGKTLYGAVSYIKTFKKAAVYAEDQGLFVIGVPG